ncbi:unnamed protein product [Calicophoron daubneyi]|uniref:Uncharacterized protein n=1 Tax=Calicophoron daubneyi TaxID=300641 RepID=A0AAV2TGT8_CALDB
MIEVQPFKDQEQANTNSRDYGYRECPTLASLDDSGEELEPGKSDKKEEPKGKRLREEEPQEVRPRKSKPPNLQKEQPSHCLSSSGMRMLVMILSSLACLAYGCGHLYFVALHVLNEEKGSILAQHTILGLFVCVLPLEALYCFFRPKQGITYSKLLVFTTTCMAFVVFSIALLSSGKELATGDTQPEEDPTKWSSSRIKTETSLLKVLMIFNAFDFVLTMQNILILVLMMNTEENRGDSENDTSEVDESDEGFY